MIGYNPDLPKKSEGSYYQEEISSEQNYQEGKSLQLSSLDDKEIAERWKDAFLNDLCVRNFS